MKRWDIDAPASSQYHEAPDGEWVEYRDVAELETLNERTLNERDAAHDRIARAVAELEAFGVVNATQQIDPEGIAHIWHALALLKGEP